ncbi:TIGR02679 domain-containing protein [[Brevibacterium] frigoritolerans]|nr:TIGR02679 domain-containing protein [Peribacillus frigoritolerans]
MEILMEAISYFKNEVGFTRLFKKFADKLESLGHIGGTITLTGITPEEKRALRNWLGDNFSKKSSVNISLMKFEKRFEGTRFEGVDFYQVIEGVVGREISYKKDSKLLEEESKKDYFNTLLVNFYSLNTQLLTDAIQQKEARASGFIKAYNQNEFNNIERIYLTVSLLPFEKKIRLPVLAERISGDPHYFDNETKLITALQIIRTKKGDFPYMNDSSVEAVNELYYEFGILKDDLQNFVTCYGLLAEKNGKKVGSWECLYEENSTHNVPLRELVKYDRIYPKKGSNVFIVENSGVFSSILDMHEGEPFSIVCTHGQFRLAGLQLIEKLCAENITIYYSGDYDPEGLQMAQRLRVKFGAKIRFWRYTIEDYEKSLTEKEITQLGVSKLSNISEMELLEVKDRMLLLKKIGYQERQIETLYKDILSLQ